MRLSALVFDAYGTLFDVHSVARKLDELFPGKGTQLSQLWRGKQLEYTWLLSLMGRYIDFDQVTSDSLRFACHTLDCAYSEEALEALRAAYRQLAMFPDAAGALSLLGQGGRQLAILSNGAPRMLEAVVEHNGLGGLLARNLLSVDAVKIYKPSPPAYRLAVEHLGVSADRIGFVSSNGWDAAGAKSFGFEVFWINRGRMPVEELGVRPDHVLNTLMELPALV
jgi:2-haloacid dehalogenase